MTTAARTATPLDPSSTRRVDDTRMKAIRPLITPAPLQTGQAPSELGENRDGFTPFTLAKALRTGSSRPV